MLSKFVKTSSNFIIITLKMLKITSFLYTIILFERIYLNLKSMIIIIIIFIIIILNRFKIRYSHVINSINL